MKTPKKKEVKKHFKNADEVESVFGNKFILGEIYISDSFSILGRVKGKTNVSHAIWSPTQGYAKILSYKEPKEKTYKITREQIYKLFNTYGNEKNDLLKKYFSEVFEEEKKELPKDFTGWAKCIGYGNEKWIGKFCKGVFEYGIGADGKWFKNEINKHNFRVSDANKEATEQEVTEALIKEAVKRGLKEGVYIIDVYNGESEKDTIRVSSNRFDWEPIGGGKNQGQMALRDSDGSILFHNGNWTKIIPTITIQEAEAKLKEIGFNAKIV